MPTNTAPHPSLEELQARTLDCIIVGAGPAGMSAAVYAARRKVDTLVITDNIGGQTNWSADIENYLGYEFMSGYELSQKFYQHLKKFDDQNDVYDLEVLQGDPVAKIEKRDGIFQVTTNQGRVFTSRTVILACGARPRMLNIPGEEKFIGRGVTFCATCDGPLYRNKTIAVIGGGNSAMEAVMYLAKLAKFIHLITINEDLRGEQALIDEVKKLDNVKVYYSTETLEVIGGDKVEKIKVRDKNSGEEYEIEVEGIFEEIGYTPNSDFVKDLVEVNAKGEVVIDEYNRTSVPGIFAAGDVSSVPYKQIVVAAGEGAKALLSVYNYLLPKNE